jgi:amidase
VAAGLSPLEIGSDIAGSIRVPAVYCGVFGHRPSDTAVPRSGHYPGWTLPNPAMVLNVLGPLARSAEDLDLALDIIAGADVGEDVAWRLEIPPPRAKRLADFRVAVLPQLDWRPVDAEVLEGVHLATEALRRAGAQVAEARPEGLGDFRDYSLLFNAIMSLIFSREQPRQERRQEAEQIRAESDDPFDLASARGREADAAEYMDWLRQREVYRAAYRAFFRDWDIMLAPITLIPAIRHIDAPWGERRLRVNGEEVRYDQQFVYPAIATLAGQPATAFPVSLSRAGLPIGLQAIGPYLEDRTTICFAGLLAEELGGFQPPPGYGEA